MRLLSIMQRGERVEKKNFATKIAISLLIRAEPFRMRQMTTGFDHADQLFYAE